MLIITIAIASQAALVISLWQMLSNIKPDSILSDWTILITPLDFKLLPRKCNICNSQLFSIAIDS